MAPVIGRHSVIDRTLSVSRVMPPTMTIAKTRKATASSQFDSASGRGWRRSAGGSVARADSIGHCLCGPDGPWGKPLASREIVPCPRKHFLGPDFRFFKENEA